MRAKAYVRQFDPSDERSWVQLNPHPGMDKSAQRDSSVVAVVRVLAGSSIYLGVAGFSPV